jgi:RNA polymerase sigma factor (TIGR02999 family)
VWGKNEIGDLDSSAKPRKLSGDGCPTEEAPVALPPESKQRGAGGVATETGTASIELVIGRDFDSYTAEEQERLLSAVKVLLGVTGDIRVINRRRGSVKLTLALTPEQVETLYWAAKRGELSAFGVLDANLPANLGNSEEPPKAAEDLNAWYEAVYKDMRRLAHSLLRQERRAHTLQTTELVNEVFIHLTRNQQGRPWKDRAQFCALAARAMRQILVDHARNRLNSKRAADGPIEGNDLAAAESTPEGRLLDLAAALEELERLRPNVAEVVNLRLFGGLTTRETADALSLSTRTVIRCWTEGRLFLSERLRDEEDPDEKKGGA